MREDNWKKREQLRQNKLRVEAAEIAARAYAVMSGYWPQRIYRGGDFKLKRMGPPIPDPLTGEVPPEELIMEVKSGRAKESHLQKATRRKNKDRHVVYRPPLFKDPEETLREFFGGEFE